MTFFISPTPYRIIIFVHALAGIICLPIAYFQLHKRNAELNEYIIIPILILLFAGCALIWLWLFPKKNELHDKKIEFTTVFSKGTIPI